MTQLKIARPADAIPDTNLLAQSSNRHKRETSEVRQRAADFLLRTSKAYQRIALMTLIEKTYHGDTEKIGKNKKTYRGPARMIADQKQKKVPLINADDRTGGR